MVPNEFSGKLAGRLFTNVCSYAKSFTQGMVSICDRCHHMDVKFMLPNRGYNVILTKGFLSKLKIVK